MPNSATGRTTKLVAILDQVATTSGVSRGQAFEDFLHMSVCALAGGTLESQYLDVVRKHANSRTQRRSCDLIAELFGRVVAMMEQTDADVLGDLFQEAISYGEAGQFLTPENLCQLMADMTIDDAVNDGRRRTVCDPCCGSGRLLLAAAKRCRNADFVGQDVDLRCVRMTALNLALRNLYGYVIWGNSLSNEQRLVYRTGFNLRGFIRECPLSDCPLPVRQAAADVSDAPPDQAALSPTSPSLLRERSGQLRLF